MECVLERDRTYRSELVISFLGSLFIALLSLIWIPMLPVPVTLQTLALFILSLALPPKICFAASFMYLVESTLGLPVLCGHSNPLWFMGPTAGYLIAFPISSALMSYVAHKKKHFMVHALALLLGQVVILGLGWLVLSFYLGAAPAFQVGVLYFIPVDLLKMGFAVAFINFLNPMKQQINLKLWKNYFKFK